jgi:hypothetical protein
MEGRVLRRAAHLLGLGLLAGAHASTIRVLLPDGRNLTLPATHTASSPALAALSPMAAPLALLFAGDACAPLAPDVPRPAIGGFVLFARRGGCVFDVKMQTAMAAGAAALVVGDTLAAEYAALSDATAQSAALTNPCIVSCTVGRGVVDASTLSLADVLGGLPSSCPAPAEYTGRRCPTNLCAFSGHAPNGSGSGGGGGGGGGDSSGGAGAQAPLLAPPPTLREVCCVLDSLGWSSCMQVLTTAPLLPHRCAVCSTRWAGRLACKCSPRRRYSPTGVLCARLARLRDGAAQHERSRPFNCRTCPLPAPRPGPTPRGSMRPARSGHVTARACHVISRRRHGDARHGGSRPLGFVSARHGGSRHGTGTVGLLRAVV